MTCGPRAGLVDALQHDTDALADGELFEARLLAAGHAGLGLAEVEDDVLQLEALDGGVQDFADAVRVLIENGVALGFADLLEDDLLGHLGGDAAEDVGGLVVADFAADFDLGRQRPRLFQSDLVERVFDLVLALDDGLEDIGADFARILVEFGTHVFLGLVVLAGCQRDRILHRGDHDLRIDALIPAQRLNAVVKHARHLFLLSQFLSVFCAGSAPR